MGWKLLRNWSLWIVGWIWSDWVEVRLIKVIPSVMCDWLMCKCAIDWYLVDASWLIHQWCPVNVGSCCSCISRPIPHTLTRSCIFVFCFRCCWWWFWRCSLCFLSSRQNMLWSSSLSIGIRVCISFIHAHEDTYTHIPILPGWSNMLSPLKRNKEGMVKTATNLHRKTRHKYARTNDGVWYGFWFVASVYLDTIAEVISYCVC